MPESQGQKARLFFKEACRLAQIGRDNTSTIEVVMRAARRAGGLTAARIDRKKLKAAAHMGIVNGLRNMYAEAQRVVVDVLSFDRTQNPLRSMLRHVQEAGHLSKIGITSEKWIEIFALKKDDALKSINAPPYSAVSYARDSIIQVLSLTHRDNWPVIGSLLVALERAGG